ncbi:hypothetical protein BAUCODRAFT_575349 [Baudoinia panamericana UAMH 10762]|uniref:WHIM1 domain-containing protein n=1 Tax=Baudoinia panamericana (strain UAMH 10762) TaxID=717646 RepID=M2N0G2_BAUPA|nr:uncharacterized protein BAUCODRAFT_575349 [Baudoinia panamericana UAMH 10762]EMC97428.1 hypothetical protein BAUCODRAFT_575349 [Baudoinia panamericana UAMH 10762]
MADDSDSSGLSSASEEEVKKLAPVFLKAKGATKLKFPPPAVSPPRPKRPPSPPHHDVFEDNPDIAVLVMFRSRFNEVMPGKLPNFGPQDIERGVTDQPPSAEVQSLLCALLSLVLNRKKPVERGHHGRALEEAVLSQKAQWPHKWNSVNPLHGPKDFNTMSPLERLDLLHTLVIWSLSSSEAIQTIVKDKYKQQRHNDDENQPLSVQPWGQDGDKRRYFLVQGLEDTQFRVYREGSRYTKNAHWYSVAGSIEEIRALAKKLDEVDGTQAARRLAIKMTNAIPNFEASEIKRTRREYRQVRRAAFTRPEPGFSLYEGRTRGKRMRYTYDDEDQAFDSDATSTRRSNRPSARGTPLADSGPTYTASGRQIRQPRQGEYGESLLKNNLALDEDELGPSSGYHNGLVGDDEDDGSEPPTTHGRATRLGGRSAQANGADDASARNHIDGYNNIDAMSDEDDAAQSGNDWDSERNEAEDEDMPDAGSDGDEPSEGDEDDDQPRSLVVRLKVSPNALLKTNGASSGERNGVRHPVTAMPNGHAEDQHMPDMEQASARAHDAEPQPPIFANGNGDGLSQPTISRSPYITSNPAASAYPTPASTSFSATNVRPTTTSAAPASTGEHTRQQQALPPRQQHSQHHVLSPPADYQHRPVAVDGWQQ